MLVPLLLFLQKPAGGLERLSSFLQRNPNFSVQITGSTPALKVGGKGSLVVRRPDSFRLHMVWGKLDYSYVKGPEGAIDYELATKTYQEYEALPGMDFETSTFAPYQEISMPLPLLGFTLTKLAGGVPFKETADDSGAVTDLAQFQGPRGSGKILAKIDKDGKLLRFEYKMVMPDSTIEWAMDFTGYVLNPQIPKDEFALEPPIGSTIWQFVLPEPKVVIGDAFKFGTWTSPSGPADLDHSLNGKLLVVRVADSPPADALVSYLHDHVSNLHPVVLSLGAKGGDYWSPQSSVGKALAAEGTPLIVLMGADGKVAGLWLGFDRDNPQAQIDEIVKAVQGKNSE